MLRLATDETCWDNEAYTCMTYLGALEPLFTLEAPASFRGPHDHQSVPLALDLGAPAALAANWLFI